MIYDITKNFVLKLKPKNSLKEYLVSQGAPEAYRECAGWQQVRVYEYSVRR
jgi:hypothetical protein